MAAWVAVRESCVVFPAVRGRSRGAGWLKRRRRARVRLLLRFELRRVPVYLHAAAALLANSCLGKGGAGRQVSLVGLGLHGRRRRGPELLDLVDKRHPTFFVNIDGLAVVGGNGLFVRVSRRPNNYYNHGDIRALDVIFKKACLLHAPPARNAMELRNILWAASKHDVYVM